jgi:hypothetical protein
LEKQTPFELPVPESVRASARYAEAKVFLRENSISSSRLHISHFFFQSPLLFRVPAKVY